MRRCLLLLFFVLMFSCTTKHSTYIQEQCEQIEPNYTWEDYEKIILHELMRREGLRVSKYICPAGFRTIGYGHVGKTIIPIRTKEDAVKQLRYDLNRYYNKISEIYEDVSLSSNKKYALASLYMNMRSKTLKNSKLEKAIKSGKDPLVYWLKYVKYKDYKTGKMRVSKNLKRSRQLEVVLWNINRNLKNEKHYGTITRQTTKPRL